MGLRKLLIALFLLVYFANASGQEYSYARYDVKEGLAGSVVYHAVEDKDGFLWFATETGVSRFDGTHFRNFTKDDGLPDNEIIKLFVDSKGRVWMTPFRNSICYYYKGKIHNQENDSLLKRIPITNQVLDIVENKQGSLLVSDFAALHFVSSTGTVKTMRTLSGLSFIVCNAGLSANGDFNAIVRHTFSDDITILKIDSQATVKQIEAFPHTIPMAAFHNYLSPGLEMSKQRDSLKIISTPGPETKFYGIPPRYRNVSFLNDSLFTINTSDGSLFYNLKTGTLLRHALPDKVVNAVLQDHEGNNWFCTAGKGIFRIGSFEFSNFTFSDKTEEDHAVFSIAKFDSLLFVGSEKSLLFTINPKTQKIRTHYITRDTANLKIVAMTRFTRSRIMLGTDEGAVIQFNSTEKGRKNDIAVKSMQADGNRLIVSEQHGLTALTEELQYIDFYYGQRSTCVYIQDKVYYMGTLNGIYVLDSTGKIVSWLGGKHALLRGRITDIEGAADGTLWITTHGEGVVGYKAGKAICSIRQKDGLTSDICRNVFIAGNDVWVGTDRGLNRIQWDKEKYHVTTFSTTNGLLSNIINAIYVDGSQVYVGTPAGLTSFDAAKISANSFCKLQMTGIQASGHRWAYDTTGFMLPPTNNATRFDFVGISYRSAGDVIYRYRLVGLDDNWQTTRETFLSYPSLPSGDYELQLIATNKFGVESEMIRIPFLVQKSLWEKTWFRILILLITGILIWIFVNTRIKKIRRQNDEKIQINNRITELEQMALKAQMNPHFIFNSLNSVQQYVIDKDLRGANKFITEFSRLIRLTLDISSRTKISIYEEISYLTTYLELEKTKFEDQFSYSVVLSPGLDPAEWFIPPMILQPYVENSIRHGVRYRKDKLGHIKLSFSLNGQYLICQIEDSGVGRKKAGLYKSEMAIEYQSKGMTLTAKRIEMLNKNQPFPVLINIEDLEMNHIAAGTRVTLQFPLQEAGSSI